MTPDILDGALRDKAAHLGRTTQFSGREWLEAFTEIRSFRPRLGGAPMLSEAESEGVDRAVISAARAGWHPTGVTAALLPAMAAYRRQRDVRRRGGGPLAVDGHAYQRRLKARRRRKR